MQARFAASELGFSLLDPLCRSEVLPKTVEAKEAELIPSPEDTGLVESITLAS